MSDFVQITLHDHGDSIEEVWAKAVSAGLYEIASVPFLHMSVTAGDVVAAFQGDRGLMFDTTAGPVKKGGRWVAVYNWFPATGATVGDVIAKLNETAKHHDLVVESCLEPRNGIAGCVYVAAPTSVTPEQLDKLMRNSGAPADLDRVLPSAFSPAKPSRLSRARPPVATSAKKKPAAKKKPPAKKKPAAKKPAKRARSKAKPAKKKKRR